MEYFESAQLVDTLATRFHLASLTHDFDSFVRASTKEISTAYKEILQKLNLSAQVDSDSFRKAKEKLRIRIALGRRWPKLSKLFGLSIIAFFPQNVKFSVCSNLVQAMPQDIFDLLVDTITTEQGKWIQQVGEQVCQYIFERLNARMSEFDGENFRLRSQIPCC